MLYNKPFKPDKNVMEILENLGFIETKMQLTLLEIPRAENNEAALRQTAAWWPAQHDEKRVAIFICPFCQVPAMINGPQSNHTIAADGTVNPSVVCGCGKFHAYIKLLDYEK